MPDTLSLRTALAANAAFSLACGLLLLFWPATAAAWLGAGPEWLWQLLGIGLAGFAADLLHQVSRPRMATWRALYAVAADVGWVLATAILLPLFPEVLSPTGNLIAAGVATAVLAFGTAQLLGIGRAHQAPGSDGYRHCIVMETNAPVDALWRVIAQLGEIRRYAPSLRSSRLREGQMPGVGAVRECEDRAGRRWAEECTEFVPGRCVSVRFLADAPDFPFPVRVMQGGWEVTEGALGARVMVWWELMPKPRWLAPVIMAMLAFQADRDFPGIVRRMAADARGEHPEAGQPLPPSVTARLIPMPC